MAYKTNTNPNLEAGFTVASKRHEVTSIQGTGPNEAWEKLNQKLVRTLDPKAEGDMLSITSPAILYITRVNGIRGITSKLDVGDQKIIIQTLDSAIVDSSQSQDTLSTLLRIYEENHDGLQIFRSAKRIVEKGGESEKSRLKVVLDETRRRIFKCSKVLASFRMKMLPKRAEIPDKLNE